MTHFCFYPTVCTGNIDYLSATSCRRHISGIFFNPRTENSKKFSNHKLSPRSRVYLGNLYPPPSIQIESLSKSLQSHVETYSWHLEKKRLSSFTSWFATRLAQLSLRERLMVENFDVHQCCTNRGRHWPILLITFTKNVVTKYDVKFIVEAMTMLRQNHVKIDRVRFRVRSYLVSFLVVSFSPGWRIDDDDCRPLHLYNAVRTMDWLFNYKLHILTDTPVPWRYTKESLSDCQSASFQSGTFPIQSQS